MGQILRVSIKGDLPGGEVWSVNPCWEINGQLGAPVSPAQALTIATALGAVTVNSSLQACMAVGTRVLGYRVESRSLAGVLESQAEFTRPTPVNGNGGTVLPYNSAIVISLRTPGVGASSRGRLYWPATGIALQAADYRISAASAGGIATGAKTYLSAMEAAIKATLPEANLTVWSRKTANFHDVNAIQVGNVVDSQRRRRDALIEGYTAVVFP